VQIDPETGRELLEVMGELDRRMAGRSFYSMFPDEDTVWRGPDTVVFKRGEKIYARRHYRKALAAFYMTSFMRESNIMAANRVGKTLAGGFAVACFTTGIYPDWWPGLRFPGPVDGWVVGQTNETTRDILQRKLFGDIAIIDGKKGLLGNGIIPAKLIHNPPSWKAGVTELVDTVRIRHVSGHYSRIGVKSYQQGRLSFEGTERDFVLLDEEGDVEIYNECLIRTMTKPKAVVLTTFTPLKGLSEISRLFIPGGND
jgi:phage terminase large subunit-like protein